MRATKVVILVSEIVIFTAKVAIRVATIAVGASQLVVWAANFAILGTPPTMFVTKIVVRVGRAGESEVRVGR